MLNLIRFAGPDRPFRIPGSAALLLVAVFSVAACAAHRPGAHVARLPAAPSPGPQELVRIWDAEHVSLPLAPLVRHAEIERRLADVTKASPDLFSLEEIGRSVEGRSINHVWFGRGPFHVLLWSQMHGDEPTATAALFDIFEYVRRHRSDPAVVRLLDRLTIHVVPMLNPDGAERFQRRNAQGIDINRDALRLQTPEGRALKALRDRLNPPIGFNLHNQSWRTSAGKSDRPASISLLAVAFDVARRDNPGRVRAKKTCAIIRDALEPLAPGRIARYDDEFEVRAFGDNLTKWGTSVVLIETGAWPSPLAPGARDIERALVRLNFVAIVSALDALATGRVNRANPARYESLPMNGSDAFYTVIRNASIVNGSGVPPFTADVGIITNRSVRQGSSGPEVHLTSRIDDLGDLRVAGAFEAIDATGLVVAPRFDAGTKVGDEIRLPDRMTDRRAIVAVGQPADLLLLRPLAGGATYRVDRIFSADVLTANAE